jgi:very-short-patch-repair endonuclease
MSDDAIRPSWREVARRQAGMITRQQLARCGVDRWAIAHRIRTERWSSWSGTVIATSTGDLTREQRIWLGVLTAGTGAMISHLTAAERAGLRNWSREEITVLVPYANDVQATVERVRFVRTRRDLGTLWDPAADPPACRLEPAVPLFAAEDRSQRTAQAVLAAAVQQGLTTSESLRTWIGRLRPLPKAPLLRRALDDISGGAHSLAEIDVARLCRRRHLARPLRQVKRRDAEGRLRFTDCEWRLPDGRTLILEVDGAFHMDVEHWEDDLARQRALSSMDRVIVRCTARELRDEPDRLADDLLALGVPRVA